MKNKWVVRGCLLPMLAGMLAAAGYARPSQEEEKEWVKKADILAKKLEAFVPEPVAALIDHMPFEPKGRGTWSNSSAICTEVNPVCYVYAGIAAGREWRFEDQALAQQVEDLQKQLDALMDRMKQEGTAEAAEVKATGEAGQKNADALGQVGDKYQAEIEKLMAKLEDPNLSEKGREKLMAQMQELLKKQQQEQQAISARAPKTPKVGEEGKKLEDQIAELKGRVKPLHFELYGNEPEMWCAGMGNPVRTGTLKGHPLYRFATTTTYALPEDVCLMVLVGPPGFKNPVLPQNGKVRADLKALQVKVWFSSSPQLVKADEAAARQMLEKIDYDGLAKLLTP